MSSTSSSRTGAMRRRGPLIPHIPCPDCRRTVEVKTSGTEAHKGWVYYKCKRHGQGCNFFHWEREYVYYLVEHNYLTGHDAIDATGWAEDRRSELELRQEERVATLPGQDQMMLTMLREVVLLLEQAVLLVKIVLACLVVAAVGSVLLYLKN